MPGTFRRRRRIIFVLTPLIDVIFLLLIFFMLSSQIAPYSLMPIGRIAAATQADASVAKVRQASQDLTLRIAHGFVSAGQERIPIGELASASERFRAKGVSRYLLLPSSAAQVQDMVSVLEALRNSGAEVTMLNSRSAEP